MVAKAPEIQSIAAEIAISERIIREEQAKVKKIKKQFASRLNEGVDIVD